MVQAPCKDCKDRHIGCHSECSRYKDFKHKNDEYKANKCREKEVYNFIRSMQINGAVKIYKKNKR